MFSYTILTFVLIFVGLGTMIYIYFGSEINFIIEKLHETIPQAIPI